MRNVILFVAWCLLVSFVSGCVIKTHIPPGQIKKQNTPAATGTAPGQAKKKP